VGGGEATALKRQAFINFSVARDSLGLLYLWVIGVLAFNSY